MAAEEIRGDYDELENCSTHFANHAQVIGQMIQAIKRSMDPLEGGGWKGRGVDAFMAEMNGDVLPATDRLYQALEEASQATKDISQTLQQAEEEASAPFRVS